MSGATKPAYFACNRAIFSASARTSVRSSSIVRITSRAARPTSSIRPFRRRSPTTGSRPQRSPCPAPDGSGVSFTQSYGASGDQARAVANGLKTDIVQLSTGLDVDYARVLGDDAVPALVTGYVKPGTAKLVFRPLTPDNNSFEQWSADGGKDAGARAKIENALKTTMENPAVRERLARVDTDPSFAPGTALKVKLENEIKNWTKFIDAKAIKAE